MAVGQFAPTEPYLRVSRMKLEVALAERVHVAPYRTLSSGKSNEACQPVDVIPQVVDLQNPIFG